MGDYNARIGRREPGDAEVPASVLGPHGLGSHNQTGRALLELASSLGLRVLNSFFRHDIPHTATWRRRRWGSLGVLDFVNVSAE